MNIHEFGKEQADVIVMFHPMGVWWDVFEYVIPILEKEYHLVIPAVPGFDPDDSRSIFTSVEEIAEEISDWLIAHNYHSVECLYGCSMGGAIVTRMLAIQKIRTDCAVIDGGITPYQLPKPLTYFIAMRDWFMFAAGKHLSLKALRSVFDPDKYTDKDLEYIKNVMNHTKYKTIWRGFYSCNNYKMPDSVPRQDCRIQYWYGEDEAKARKWDIEYILRIFPNAQLIMNKGQDHAECFTLHPVEFCQMIKSVIADESMEDSECRGNRCLK